MFDPQPIQEGFVTHLGLQPELLVPAGLPPGERGRRKRYGVGDLDFASEQLAKAVHDIKDCRLADAVGSKKQRRVL